MRHLFLFFMLALAVSCSPKYPTPAPVTVDPRPTLDLANPADNLAAFIKMRATLVPNEESVYYWQGRIYSFVPGERSQPLFDLEAYNISRIVTVEGGYQMLTREVAVYRDIATGAILESWDNPLNQKKVDVVHVWNDPVNQQLMLKGRFGDWGVPYQQQGDGRVVMYSDIFLTYPSPLPQADFPLNSRSDTYQAAELFQFFIDERALLDPNTTDVYSEVGWTRISDFLPWMEMAEQPGYLVYQCRGHKLAGGFAALPSDLRAYVQQKQPTFTSAPTEFTSPNMTSWRYFKQLKDNQ